MGWYPEIRTDEVSIVARLIVTAGSGGRFRTLRPAKRTPLKDV